VPQADKAEGWQLLEKLKKLGGADYPKAHASNAATLPAPPYEWLSPADNHIVSLAVLFVIAGCGGIIQNDRKLARTHRSA
jgi:hypothetical protein